MGFISVKCQVHLKIDLVFSCIFSMLSWGIRQLINFVSLSRCSCRTTFLFSILTARPIKNTFFFFCHLSHCFERQLFSHLCSSKMAAIFFLRPISVNTLLVTRPWNVWWCAIAWSIKSNFPRVYVKICRFARNLSLWVFQWMTHKRVSRGVKLSEGSHILWNVAWRMKWRKWRRTNQRTPLLRWKLWFQAGCPLHTPFGHSTLIWNRRKKTLETFC